MSVRVLVACEFSGIVRTAFSDLGYDAVSCDFLPTEIPGEHVQGNVLDILDDGWDLMIAHPPCRYLAISGNRWASDPVRQEKRQEAFEFFMTLYNAPIPRIAVENPIGVVSTMFRKPDQYVHPWQHGVGETKAIGLWLRNLPEIEPTKFVPGRKRAVLNETDWSDRWRQRARFYPSVARAMAQQWSEVL